MPIQRDERRITIHRPGRFPGIICIPKSEVSSPCPTPSLSDSPEPSPPRKTVTIRYECEVCQKVFVFTLEYTTPDDLKGVADAVIFCSVCAEIALKDFRGGFSV